MNNQYNSGLLFELDEFVAKLEDRGYDFPEILAALKEYTDLVEDLQLA